MMHGTAWCQYLCAAHHFCVNPLHSYVAMLCEYRGLKNHYTMWTLQPVQVEEVFSQASIVSGIQFFII